MDRSKIFPLCGREKVTYFARIFLIILVFSVINSCNAYSYTEKKNPFEGDRNCFCEVSIQQYLATGTKFTDDFFY